jgi:hypothetical protein
MPAMMRIGSALFVSAAVLVAGACDKGSKDKAGAALSQKDGPAGLKAVFEASQAACAAKDFGTGKQIVKAMIPTKEQLKKLVKDEVTADQLERLADQFKELPPDDAKAACVFAPQGRTEIKVHSATVEELVAYKQGTPAFDEFPGGAQKLAEKVLKPGTTFYEVKVTEPGKDRGSTFHMFFWDGAQWRMMGPAWRVLTAD